MIIVVAEGATDNATGLAQYSSEHNLLPEYEFRSTALGYVQRGAVPACADRLLGTRLGAEAVEQIASGRTGILVGIRSGDTITTPLETVMHGRKPLDPRFLKMAKMPAR